MAQSSVSQGGNEAGATRTLVLGPNAEGHETLKKHSDEKMSYTYRIPLRLNSTTKRRWVGPAASVPEIPATAVLAASMISTLADRDDLLTIRTGG